MKNKTTKVQITSDLHFESNRDEDTFFYYHVLPDTDILIVAGDISSGTRLNKALKSLLRFSEDRRLHCIYVRGNHEYYGLSPKEHDEIIQDFKGKEFLHILHNEVINLFNLKIAGTTMWFKDYPDNTCFEEDLNDFHCINNFKPWVYEQNKSAAEFIETLSEIDIMITHHLPTYQAIDAYYKGSSINRFFVCPILETLKYLPRIWVHGHSHSSFDSIIDGCRLIRNPRGTDMKSKFKKLVIEL